MCSICGIIDFINTANLNKDLIIEMGKEAIYRGAYQNDHYIDKLIQKSSLI